MEKEQLSYPTNPGPELGFRVISAWAFISSSIFFSLLALVGFGPARFFEVFDLFLFCPYWISPGGCYYMGLTVGMAIFLPLVVFLGFVVRKLCHHKTMQSLMFYGMPVMLLGLVGFAAFFALAPSWIPVIILSVVYFLPLYLFLFLYPLIFIGRKNLQGSLYAMTIVCLITLLAILIAGSPFIYLTIKSRPLESSSVSEEVVGELFTSESGYLLDTSDWINIDSTTLGFRVKIPPGWVGSAQSESIREEYSVYFSPPSNLLKPWKDRPQELSGEFWEDTPVRFEIKIWPNYGSSPALRSSTPVILPTGVIVWQRDTLRFGDWGGVVDISKYQGASLFYGGARFDLLAEIDPLGDKDNLLEYTRLRDTILSTLEIYEVDLPRRSSSYKSYEIASDFIKQANQEILEQIEE